jgi:hypothetical protein
MVKRRRHPLPLFAGGPLALVRAGKKGATKIGKNLKHTRKMGTQKIAA